MRLSAFLLLLSLSVAQVWAQATANITGSVKDQSGAAIPGARIKVIQTATGVSRNGTATQDGSFALTNLPLGPYMLEVTKEGFAKSVETGLVLQVDTSPNVDIVLKVGQVTDQVTVEAGAAQVETHATGVGQVVDNQRVAEMPLNGRNPIELVFLAGMASAPGDGAINTVRNYPTVVVSVAGGQGNGVGYRSTAQSSRIPTTTWPAAALPGRASGIQGGNQRAAGAVWLPLDGRGQRGHEIRHQRISWRPVRVCPQRRAQRPRLFRR